MELPLITLLTNAAVLAIVILVIRRWTADAKDEAIKTAAEAKTIALNEAEGLKHEIDKVQAELHSHLSEVERRLNLVIDRKLDRDLFDAKMETNLLAHIVFERAAEKFEQCVTELKRRIDNIKLTSGI